MTPNEAKEYLLKLDDYSEKDFVRPDDEDVECDIFKSDDWIVYCYCGYPVNEGDYKSAVELAEDHKFWSDPKSVDNYIDFMNNEDNFK